jgi:hypothetical protein
VQAAATGKSGEPLQRLLEAIEDAGWHVDLCEAVSVRGGPNPTRLDLSKGQDRRGLLVYSWNITGEGKGRSRDDYRIQTTRTHEGPLMLEADRTTVGIGWDPKRAVFAAFEGWTKRYTGKSSSVHIKRALLEAAVANGFDEGGERWDRRLAFDSANVAVLMDWLRGLEGRREAAMPALSVERVDPMRAEIVGDVWGASPVPWLRGGDRLVALAKSGDLLDDSLWRIEDLEGFAARGSDKRYPRTHVRFRCRRIGQVEDSDALERLR